MKFSNLGQNLHQKTQISSFVINVIQKSLKKTSQNPHEQNPN